ncbi:hypothetical protein [Glutamicibacter sp.]|uniref:hypothetical protein n=1 Tax=Glutamicibacter sp. TaxID=1931995 RepID=UPI002B4A9E25|nr:hypothetical protein [Glutamicibacter sp.]HJX79063.1 hypothetical protein [Glutamicibacter sp.]
MLVGAVLIGIFGLLTVSHLDPGFLKNNQELTSQANAGTPIVQGPVVPKALPTQEVTTAAELRSSQIMAVEAGRPEAAWDKHCVAWDFAQTEKNPSPESKQAMKIWLGSHEASCPDAIAWPDYFVQVFSASGAGELTVLLEPEAATEKLLGNPVYSGLEKHAQDIAERLAAELPELREVTMKIESSPQELSVAIN